MSPADRRRQLLDVARQVVTVDGFGALTIESVAREAGVTRPVVYDLFGDLDGLVTALIDREQQIALAPLLELVGRGEPPAGTGVEEFLTVVLTGFLEAVHVDKPTWRLVLMPPQRVSPEIRRRFTDSRELLAARIAKLLEWGWRRRGDAAQLDWELLGRLVVAVGEDAARLTLMSPRKYRPERLVLAAVAVLSLIPPGAGVRTAGRPAPELTVPEPPAPAEPQPAGKRMAREARRNQLLDAALAVIDDGDWDALTVDAIAKRAGVDRVVVYRSFGRLELLTVALLAREEQRTRGLTDAIVPAKPWGETGALSPAEILGGAVARLLEEVLSKPLTYRVALRRPESLPPALRKIVNARRASIAKRLRPLVELGLAGVDAPTADIDVELLSRMILTAGEELARLALHEPDFPPERVLSGAWSLLEGVPAR
ncbi:MAG: TetR/AcrR family transcriptional regulator [Baekduia sp.]